MTDIPTHDQFALPSESVDSAASGGTHPPAPLREREGEASGSPSEDWRARGLAHPAGRGWVGEGNGSAPTRYQVKRPPDVPGHAGGMTDLIPPSRLQEGSADAGSPFRLREGRETCGPEGDAGRSGVGCLDGSERMGTAGWTVLTPERLGAFLAQLAECGNVRLACRAAGISPQTVYRARRKSAALARQWDAAILAARPIAEEALADKAMHGWLEAQFYRGEPCGEKYRFDGRLLLAHLGRLDKLAARVAAERRMGESAGEAAALAGLDAALETLGRGEALVEPAAPGAAAKPAHDTVPGVPSSPAPIDWGPDWCPRCGDHTLGPDGACREAECRDLTVRVARMEAARPAGEPDMDALLDAHDTLDDIEGMQLAAFEAGAAQWWKICTEDEFEAAMAALMPGEELDAGEDEDLDEGEGGTEPAAVAQPEQACEPAQAGTGERAPRAAPSIRTI